MNKVLSTADLDDVCREYLERLSGGEVEAADQRVAAVLLGEKIRRLENSVGALMHDLRLKKKNARRSQKSGS